MKKLRTIFIILSITWMVVVFLFSNEPSDESKNTSSFVTEIIANIIYGDNLPEKELTLKIQELDPIIRKIQGANRHVGRIGKIIDQKIDNKNNQKGETESKAKTNPEESKIEKLQNDLKLAIQEERYEDAAKIRDEIKKLEK